MSKQQGDFITYVRNGAAINALVAFSRDVYTPATQTVPASTVEHLTLVYLDPSAASSGIQTGEQLRSSVKTEFSVAPLTEGKVNGWKDVGPDGPPPAQPVDPLQKSSGIDGDAGDWTQAGDGTGYPETRGFQKVADTASALYRALSNKPIAEVETLLTDAEKDELVEKATADIPETADVAASQSAPGDRSAENQAQQVPSVGIGQPAQ